jgi:hypothetical protein
MEPPVSFYLLRFIRSDVTAPVTDVIGTTSHNPQIINNCQVVFGRGSPPITPIQLIFVPE